MTRRLGTCYISAPAGTDLKNIRSALSKRGIGVLVPEDSASHTEVVSDVPPLMSQADLVIGVLTRERRSQWVLFELGQAVALGKQIVLFAPPGSDILPTDLRRFLTLRINLSNRAAIEFALDQVLAAPARASDDDRRRMEGGSYLRKKDEGKGLGPQADKLLPELREAIAKQQERRFEELVACAIRSSGVDVVAEAPIDDRRFDLAIWSDALQPLISSPLPIELKLRLENPSEVRAALQQCLRSAQAAGSTWSLLIYGEGLSSRDKIWSTTAPTVLAISIDELVREMRVTPFVEIVRRLRNLRVHGRGSD
jgi:hypothetical protein